MTHQPSIAVIGGGLAGLTAATVAARAGARVTLFERGGSPGGRAATVERDGTLLNVGPHALYRGGAAARILPELGVAFTGARPRVGGFALIGRRRRLLPAGASSLALSGALTPRGKYEFGRALASLDRLDLRALQAVTLREWIDANLGDRTAKRAFEASTRVASYGNAPDLASAGATLGQLSMGRRGVLYLDGGWQTLVDGLFLAATNAGAEICTRANVTNVTRDDGRWRVSPAAGERRFDAVVLAVGPRLAAKLAGAPADSPLGAWGREAVPVRAAVLDVLLAGLPRPKNLFALGFDRPTYFSVHSAWARLAPEGQALVTAAWYRAPTDTDEGAIEDGLEHVLDTVQPGWRDRVLFRRFIPNLVVANDYVRAATAGFEARPGPEVPGMPGLFVAGDWVGPEGMLADAAVASGARAGALAAAAIPSRLFAGTVAAAG